MCEDPAKLKAYLFENGIDAIGFMMRNCAHEPAFRDYYHHCPGAEKVMKTTVLIPIHSSFTKNDMKYMAEVINNFD
jgi:dTDP-4-amino-4,6-dideoxygalactose transaminase